MGRVTVDQAAEVRRLHDSRIRSREISSMTGISIRTINEILDGRYRPRELTAQERYEDDARTGWAPLCMTDEEWVTWRRDNRSAIALGFGEANASAGRPCADCPLGFAADMRAQGRCNGTPLGVPDDDLAPDPLEAQEVPQLMEPKPQYTPTGLRAEPGIRMPVSIEIPCPRCVKADVCAVKPKLEQLTELPVMAPRPDPIIKLSLAAEVTCLAFVRASKARSGPSTTGSGPKLAEADRRQTVLDALERNAGDVRATAVELGITPMLVSRIRNANARAAAVPA